MEKRLKWKMETKFKFKIDNIETFLNQGSSSETILPCACISRWVHWYDDKDDGDDDDDDDHADHHNLDYHD